MNRDSYVTVALAISCIAAAGMASTTLASTLTQEPDDVIDIDFSKLPLGEDDGKVVRDAVNNGEGTATPSGGNGREDGSESSDSSRDSSSESQQSQRSSDSTEAGASGGSGGESGGSNSGELSLLQRLLFLLQQLMPLIVLLVLLALAYRYRRNLLALVLAVAGIDGDSAGEWSPTAAPWPSERPSNEVHRAWLSMVERLDVDRPQHRTPGQCADAAVAADMDPSAVETLTNVFEEVRYGDAPVTDERRRRAREGLQGLDGGSRGRRGSPTGATATDGGESSEGSRTPSDRRSDGGERTNGSRAARRGASPAVRATEGREQTTSDEQHESDGGEPSEARRGPSDEQSESDGGEDSVPESESRQTESDGGDRP